MISESHPEFQAMTAAIFSDEGQRLAQAAARAGKPALVGVDPMLAETFVRYRDGFHESTKNAGFIVARLMRDELHYTKGDERVPCTGCVVKTATMWLPPTPGRT
jgi:hypothetical protein